MMRNRREWRDWRNQLVHEHAPVRVWEAEDSYRDVCQACDQRWPCRTARATAQPEPEEPA